MNDEFLDEFLYSLRFHVPFLAVYTVAVALAVVNRQRCPVPCLYLLGASVIQLLSIFSYALANTFAVRGDLNLVMYEVAVFGIAVIDAGGYGLMLAAIFQGRSAATRRRPSPYWEDPFDDPPPPPGPGSKFPGDPSGIQEKPNKMDN